MDASNLDVFSMRGVWKKMLSGLKERVDSFFYKCEYIKECSKLTPQCRHGGNSYCGEYKKRLRNA